MRKITWTWKKILTLICGFLGIGTLVSCYGMPFDPEFYPLDELIDNVSGTIFGDIDKDSNLDRVPGIKITATTINNDEECISYSDKDGNFKIQFAGEYKNGQVNLLFEDVDGEENGSFKSLNITAKQLDNGDIILENKD